MQQYLITAQVTNGVIVENIHAVITACDQRHAEKAAETIAEDCNKDVPGATGKILLVQEATLIQIVRCQYLLLNRKCKGHKLLP